MKATQQLKDEHEGIQIMLDILERVCRQWETTGSLKPDHMAGILEFLKIFVDKCHHGKEEDLLFPALIAAGVPKEGPIAVMLHEHEVGRNHVRAIDKAYAAYTAGDQSSTGPVTQNAYAYIALLKEHIAKENTILFVMADNRLSETDQNDLYEGFEKIEEERIGVGRHEEFHRLLDGLREIYLN